VAQDRTLTAGENASHEAAVEGEAAVADGVNAAVDAVERPLVRSLRNRVAGQSCRFKLLERNHTMLPSADSGDLSVGRVEFVAHAATKSTRHPFSPP
jgi:hypothetical protein